MSGVTDQPFRLRADRHGAGLVVSEMIAGGELARDHAGSRRRLRKVGRSVHMVQIAGRDAAVMTEAARIAVGEGADIVDINMGCPAKKVTGGYAGSALMREPNHAVALVEAVLVAVDVPVTVKMRLGWDEESLNAPEIARRAEAAGVAMITVHGRTRCQFYTGKADWRAIAKVKAAVTVPVVANGDVRDASDAEEILEQSGADAVMIGRASYGAPWTAGSLARQAAGTAPCGDIPEGGTELADYVIGHYEDMLALYGVDVGLRHARKHLGWYLDRFAPDAHADFRSGILTSIDPLSVRRDLRRAFVSSEATWREDLAA